MNTAGDSEQLDVAWVPGSFELPLVAQQLARSGRYQVVITLGAVIRGDTPHFDVVSEASKGIAAVARDTGVPVIFGVLTTDTMQQALERAGIKSNLAELWVAGPRDGVLDEDSAPPRCQWIDPGPPCSACLPGRKEYIPRD